MHSPKHNSDFNGYFRTRARVLKNIKQLRCYLSQLETVVKAMPATNDAAGYLDLDNCQQLDCDLSEAVGLLVDWESVHAAMKEIAIAKGVQHG